MIRGFLRRWLGIDDVIAMVGVVAEAAERSDAAGRARSEGHARDIDRIDDVLEMTVGYCDVAGRDRPDDEPEDGPPPTFAEILRDAARQSRELDGRLRSDVAAALAKADRRLLQGDLATQQAQEELMFLRERVAAAEAAHKALVASLRHVADAGSFGDLAWHLSGEGR